MNTFCAAEGDTCYCEEGMFVYYGAEDDPGELNSYRNFYIQEADSSGATSCSNDVFGDPLKYTEKACFCFVSDTVFEDSSYMFDYDSELCEYRKKRPWLHILWLLFCTPCFFVCWLMFCVDTKSAKVN